MSKASGGVDYTGLAKRIRVHALRMTNRAHSSHIGGCLSAAELLAVLYGGILRIDPSKPDWLERDRFILSKGHAAAATYAILAERGFFPLEWLDSFYLDGSHLAGHITGVCQVLKHQPALWDMDYLSDVAWRWPGNPMGSPIVYLRYLATVSATKGLRGRRHSSHRITSLII